MEGWPTVFGWRAEERGFWSGDGVFSRVGIEKSSNGEDILQKVGVFLSYLAKSWVIFSKLGRGSQNPEGRWRGMGVAPALTRGVLVGVFTCQ